jgi:hypothetical protein
MIHTGEYLILFQDLGSDSLCVQVSYAYGCLKEEYSSTPSALISSVSVCYEWYWEHEIV